MSVFAMTGGNRIASPVPWISDRDACAPRTFSDSRNRAGAVGPEHPWLPASKRASVRSKIVYGTTAMIALPSAAFERTTVREEQIASWGQPTRKADTGVRTASTFLA